MRTQPPPPLADVPESTDIAADLMKLMASPDLASRRWIWEQYDHMVMGDTIERPGGDAGIVRIHGTNKGLAISCDVTPRYCAADPTEGAKQAVAECWRNITATGADKSPFTGDGVVELGRTVRARSRAEIDLSSPQANGGG